MVTLFFSGGAREFEATMRDGLRSRRAEGSGGLSARVRAFQIVSAFTPMPRLVTPAEIRATSWPRPRWCHPLTVDRGIVFTPDFVLQIFCLGNIINRLFEVYRLFFDVGEKQYELAMLDLEELLFAVVLFREPVPLRVLKRRVRPVDGMEWLVEDVSFWDIKGNQKSITVGEFELGPISCFLLMTTVGHCPRFNQPKRDNEASPK
jgi:hypothetical protein